MNMVASAVIHQLFPQTECRLKEERALRIKVYASLNPIPELLHKCDNPVLMIIRSAHYFIGAMRMRHVDIFTKRGAFLSHTYIQNTLVEHFSEAAKNHVSPERPERLYGKFFTYLKEAKLELHAGH